MPWVLYPLEFSQIEREARVVFIYLNNKSLLPGPRLKLKLIYYIRPLWRIIYKNYDDVICEYLLLSIALNYGLTFGLLGSSFGCIKNLFTFNIDFFDKYIIQRGYMQWFPWKSWHLFNDIYFTELSRNIYSYIFAISGKLSSQS